MIIQICICALIYTAFYVIKNGQYIFTEQVIEQINSLLAYDMNIEKVSDDILKYINDIRNKNVVIPEENKEQSNTEQPNENETDVGASDARPEESNAETTNNIENEQTENTEQQLPEEILGVTDEAQYTENANEWLTDVEYIKQNYSIIKPLDGTITSKFGSRNPTTPTVPTYHTGIDIARETGTKIIAAMEGNVTQVSSEGDYRKTFENTKWRCNNIICTL